MTKQNESKHMELLPLEILSGLYENQERMIKQQQEINLLRSGYMTINNLNYELVEALERTITVLDTCGPSNNLSEFDKAIWREVLKEAKTALSKAG